MSLEWGYCEHCNKEVPVVANMLEVHHTMSPVDQYSNTKRVECNGSMREPSPMPEGGDAERYRFLDTSPDPAMAASGVTAMQSPIRRAYERMRQHVEGQTYPPVEPHERGLLRMGEIGHYGGIDVPVRVEVDGVDMSDCISSVEISDETYVFTHEQIDAAIRDAGERLANVQYISNATIIPEALLPLQGASMHLEFDRENLDRFIADIPVTPTPLGAIADGWGGIHYPDDPAEAFRLAGVRVDEPVRLVTEYSEPDDIMDFICDRVTRIRNTTYRIAQYDSRGILMDWLDVTHLLNHYQGRVGIRTIVDETYLSFS